MDGPLGKPSARADMIYLIRHSRKNGYETREKMLTQSIALRPPSTLIEAPLM